MIIYNNTVIIFDGLYMQEINDLKNIELPLSEKIRKVIIKIREDKRWQSIDALLSLWSICGSSIPFENMRIQAGDYPGAYAVTDPRLTIIHQLVMESVRHQKFDQLIDQVFCGQ